MASIHGFFDWFTGADHQYETLWHCMAHDSPWVITIAVLCVSIIVGYIIIAYHWYKNLAALKPGIAKSSLFSMVNIFVFCGICGYLFPLIKMWWPAWRLHAIFLAVLSFFTWKYCLNTPKLKVVYEEIQNVGEMTEKLQAQKVKQSEVIDIAEKAQTPLDSIATQVMDIIENPSLDYDQDRLTKIKSELGKLENSINQIRQTLG